MFWVFDHEACRISAPQPGIEPTTPALEGEVLTTGFSGKSLEMIYVLNRQIKALKKKMITQKILSQVDFAQVNSFIRCIEMFSKPNIKQ